jgi:hypothetical protein
MKMSGLFHALAALPTAESPRYTLDRILCQTQRWFETGDFYKNSIHCHCRESMPGRPSRSLVAVLTELPIRFVIFYMIYLNLIFLSSNLVIPIVLCLLIFIQFMYTHTHTQSSSDGIATDYGLDDRLIGGSIPGRGWETFLFDTMSTPALGPSQPPIQWVPGSLSLG